MSTINDNNRAKFKRLQITTKVSTVFPVAKGYRPVAMVFDQIVAMDT